MGWGSQQDDRQSYRLASNQPYALELGACHLAASSLVRMTAQPLLSCGADELSLAEEGDSSSLAQEGLETAPWRRNSTSRSAGSSSNPAPETAPKRKRGRIKHFKRRGKGFKNVMGEKTTKQTRETEKDIINVYENSWGIANAMNPSPPTLASQHGDSNKLKWNGLTYRLGNFSSDSDTSCASLAICWKISDTWQKWWGKRSTTIPGPRRGNQRRRAICKRRGDPPNTPQKVQRVGPRQREQHYLKTHLSPMKSRTTGRP